MRIYTAPCNRRIQIRCTAVFLALLEPKIFVKYNLVNYMYAAAALMCMFFLMLHYLNNRKKMPMLFFWAVLMRLSFFIQTLNIHGDLLQWGYLSVVLMGIVLVYDLYFQRSPIAFLRALQNVLMLYAVINFATMILFPDGIQDGNYFLGIRTRMTEYVFPMMVVSLMCDWMYKKRMSVKTLAALCLGVVTVFYQWIATALVGIAVMLIAYCVLTRVKHFSKVGVGIIILFGMLVSVAVVFFQAQKLFASLIENILHKQVDLTYRTTLWSLSVVKILASPLFGYGLQEDGLHIMWFKEFQTHNHWMQILCDGGLVYLATYVLFSYFCGKELKSAHKSPLINAYLALYASFMVMAITEIYIYSPIFYVVLLLGRYLCYAENGEVRLSEVA